MVLTDQRQIDLAHELVVETLAELGGGHRLQWSEMGVAGGGNDGVDLPGLLEHGADRGFIGQVDVNIPRLAARLDDLVAAAKLIYGAASHGSFGTDNKNAHY